MRRIALIPMLFILCSLPALANVTNVAERDGETYFSINGNNAEFMGIFGQPKDPMMWKVTQQELMGIEQTIQNVANSKTTNQYSTDNRSLTKVRLTDKETSLLKTILSKTCYRVYTAGTNSKRDKIMEITYYPNSDSGAIFADIMVNLTISSVQIRLPSPIE